MRIVVIGATISTHRIISELLRSREHDIVAIVTLAPKYAIRKARFFSLDDIAALNGIDLVYVHRISDLKTVNIVEKLNPDLIIESGWSQIIPSSILSIPNKGCIGLHYGWLPDYRGGASLNWALIRGEKEWGASLFYLVERVDEGDIIDRRRFKIEDRDNIRTIYDKADALAVSMIRDNLASIENGSVRTIRQTQDEGAHLARRKPTDGEIDWTRPSATINNLIRSITKPYPGAFTSFNGQKLIVWESESSDPGFGTPGTVTRVADGRGIVTNTGAGGLLITRAQIEGEIEQWGDDLAHDLDMKQGDAFG